MRTWARLLSRLSSCDTIAFSDQHDAWGRVRLLDNIGKNINLERYILEDFTPAGTDALIAETKMFLQWALKILLGVLIRSRERMKHVRVEVGPVDMNHCSWPFEEALTPALLHGPRELPRGTSLDNIETLRLAVSATPTETWETELLQFIGLFSRLSYLRVFFKQIAHEFNSLARRLSIPGLQRLELARFVCRGEKDLVDLLLRHSDLLQEVTLECAAIEPCQGWKNLVRAREGPLQACTLTLKDCFFDHVGPARTYLIMKHSDCSQLAL